MYREFWRLFVKDYGRLHLVILISVVTMVVSLLEGLNIGLLIPLLENLQSPGEKGNHWVSRAFFSLFDALGLPSGLGTILLFLGVIILVLSVFKYLRLILAGKAAADFVVWMRSKTMSNLLHTDLAYFHHEKIGALTGTLTYQAGMASSTLTIITEAAASIGVITAYLITAFLISPALTFIALVMLLVIYFVVQPYIVRAKILGGHVADSNNELEAAAVENLSGIRVIKMLLLEQFKSREFNDSASNVRDATVALLRNRAKILAIQEIALFTLIGGIVYAGVAILKLEISVIVALLFILYRLTPRVTGVNSMRQAVASNAAAVRYIIGVMDDTVTPSISSGNQRFDGLREGIELKNISFSYNGGANVLQDTNVYLEKGKVTALVGMSGAGKSTLVDMILRFYDPTSGSVNADGVDIKNLDLESWRNSIGVVSQDVYLFNDSVSNNIGLGQPGSSKESILTVAKQAYAHDFIQQLPQGYETLVGDRGSNLSGGQRQRIALARAILKRPQILILDEATSSLDSESEQLVQDYIDEIRGSCTILVVAHRMSTIRSADKIAVLQDGRIVEEGDWDALLTEAGVFANFHRLQIRD
jgi:subfamily B ATP-binding cassette protein MsbA